MLLNFLQYSTQSAVTITDSLTLMLFSISSKELGEKQQQFYLYWPFKFFFSGKKMGKTNVAKKTLDPVWNFHAYIPLQTDKPISLIEIFVWDKDKITEMKLKDILMIKKDAIQDDFLGKISIPYSQLFNLVHPSGKSLDYDSPDNKEVVLALEKRSVDDNVSGEIQIKFGLTKI